MYSTEKKKDRGIIRYLFKPVAKVGEIPTCSDHFWKSLISMSLAPVFSIHAINLTINQVVRSLGRGQVNASVVSTWQPYIEKSLLFQFF